MSGVQLGRWEPEVPQHGKGSVGEVGTRGPTACQGFSWGGWNPRSHSMSRVQLGRWEPEVPQHGKGSVGEVGI